MELSPNGSLLAGVDVLGNVSLYDVPSLRLRKQWSVEEQVSLSVGVSSTIHCNALISLTLFMPTILYQGHLLS